MIYPINFLPLCIDATKITDAKSTDAKSTDAKSISFEEGGNEPDDMVLG
jgi:hypothetical protein